MDPLLKILQSNARTGVGTLAKMLDLPEAEIEARIRDYETRGIIRGYQAVLSRDQMDDDRVMAIIEVKVSPEREGGFNHLALRISRFPEVLSCHLISGQADLLLFVEGETLREVAAFVSERLSTIPGVNATSTSFLLKTYKHNGLLMETPDEHERLKITP